MTQSKVTILPQKELTFRSGRALLGQSEAIWLFSLSKSFDLQAFTIATDPCSHSQPRICRAHRCRRLKPLQDTWYRDWVGRSTRMAQRWEWQRFRIGCDVKPLTDTRHKQKWDLFSWRLVNTAKITFKLTTRVYASNVCYRVIIMNHISFQGQVCLVVSPIDVSNPYTKILHVLQVYSCADPADTLLSVEGTMAMELAIGATISCKWGDAPNAFLNFRQTLSTFKHYHPNHPFVTFSPKNMKWYKIIFPGLTAASSCWTMEWQWALRSSLADGVSLFSYNMGARPNNRPLSHKPKRFV